MAPKKQRRARGRISLEEARFIELTLQTGAPAAKKQALQRLCKLLRQGKRLELLVSMKALVIICLNDADSKVKRWAMNALALIGTLDDVPFIEAAWLANRSDSDVFEAGLTTLAHILSKDDLLALLKRTDVNLDEGTILALAQQSEGFAEELSAVRLQIEQAHPHELRSATLLIGLQKAPDTLFSDRFPVSDVIGDLNTHEDLIVSQYSFWATVEHAGLGIGNIRVAPAAMSGLPPNVQGWAYRVLTKDPAVAATNLDIIFSAAESSHVEVREGIATGIREIFEPSLSSFVLDWFIDETDKSVREKLLEHMATNVAGSSDYRDEVTRAFRMEAPNSLLRARLEASCKYDPVSLDFRKMALQTGDPDLFNLLAGGHVTNNNTQNFHATVNAGGISNSGTGNAGDVKIISVTEAQNQATQLLQELRRVITSLADGGAVEGSDLIEAAIEEPSQGKVQQVVEWLETASQGGQAVASLSTAAGEIGSSLADLIQYLPPIF